jgi:hypothetical protein
MGETARTMTLDIELFRDVFNASPIGIAVETLEGQPLFVNPAFREKRYEPKKTVGIVRVALLGSDGRFALG